MTTNRSMSLLVAIPILLSILPSSRAEWLVAQRSGQRPSTDTPQNLTAATRTSFLNYFCAPAVETARLAAKDKYQADLDALIADKANWETADPNSPVWRRGRLATLRVAVANSIDIAASAKELASRSTKPPTFFTAYIALKNEIDGLASKNWDADDVSTSERRALDKVWNTARDIDQARQLRELSKTGQYTRLTAAYREHASTIDKLAGRSWMDDVPDQEVISLGKVALAYFIDLAQRVSSVSNAMRALARKEWRTDKQTTDEDLCKVLSR